MTENTFKASNGCEIRSNFGYFDEHEDCYEVRDIDDYILHRLGQGSLQALREYFRHERDTELGRTRWPEDPDYVIYRDPDHDDEDGRCVEVLHEPTAYTETVWERRTGKRWDEKPIRTIDMAARWYFTEGPGKEPERPWENAKADEVWRITVEGGDGTFLVCETIPGRPYFLGQASSFYPSDTGITAGRKLLEADGTPAEGCQP